MKFNFKKSAFTLSEIMVTIALIGFLATLTLSTVGASVQQRSRLAQFRAAHSKMASVLRNIIIEDGIVYDCYNLPTDDEKDEFGLNLIDGTPRSSNLGCEALTNRFVRAMGATRTCMGDATEGCVPKNYPTASGCFVSYDNVGAYVLDNSMIIVTDSQNNMRNFLVDVNGRKGPNIFGQDIFIFSVKATESIDSYGKIVVSQLGILPGDGTGNACQYDIGASSKSALQMMRESAGYKKKTKK